MNNQLATIEPQSMPELIQVSEVLAKTELVPQSFQGKPNDIVAAVMLGNEIGLKPMQALRSVAVINGRATLWGDSMLALVMASPVYKKISETFNTETLTATCVAERKDGTINTQTFSKEDATKAGLWGKKGPWTQYSQRMLQMRARGFCLRDTFPDVLNGFITAEEAQDTPVQNAVIEEVIEITDQLNNCQNMDELVNVWGTLSADDKMTYTDLKDSKKAELS